MLASCITRNKSITSSSVTVAENSAYEKNRVLGKAVIPENNPAPVSVNREDAATPTPISFTEKIVDNKMGINVKIKNLRSTEVYEYRQHIAILNSYNELMQIWQKDEKKNYDLKKSNYENNSNYHFDENEYYINWYNEEFFDNNALIMLFFTRGSGAYTCTVDYVARENDRMYIYVNNADIPKGAAVTCDMLYPRVFISVPKKDMKKIKDIVVYNDEY